jgi:ribosomal protein S18 acetylase RimI-like enzyme
MVLPSKLFLFLLLHSLVSSSSLAIGSSAPHLTCTMTNLIIRPYQASDKTQLLEIFAANIREEWQKYHNGIYAPNAERYIDSVISEKSQSDLHTIPETYGDTFWVLVHQEENDSSKVVGMVGLQVSIPLTDPTNGNQYLQGEIRRNCILPAYRGLGWGTKMCQQIQQVARDKGLQRLFCSTPEHGDDVIRFYNKLGFTEFGPSRQETMHGTPIKEVFLEWKVQ